MTKQTETTPGTRFQEALRKEYANSWYGIYNDETRAKLGDNAWRLNMPTILRALQIANDSRRIAAGMAPISQMEEMV